MKQIVLAFILVSLTPLVWSQDITFYSSIKGNVFGSTIINRSITDDDNQNYSFALAGSGGVGGSFYFFDKIGISVDFLIGNHKAVYKGQDLTIGEDQIGFQSEINYRSIHIPLLLSILSHGDKKDDLGTGYFEMGTQFNNCMNPTYKFDGFDQNMSDYFSNTYWSGIFGFGMVNSLGRRSPLDFTLGLRIEYGLQDIGSVNAFGVPIDTNNGDKSLVFGIGFQLAFLYQLPIATNNSYLKYLK